MKLMCLAILIVVTYSCQKIDDPVLNDQYWELSTPEAAGVNTAPLNDAISIANSATNFYSLLVTKNGKLVVEEYFNGFHENSRFHIRSITKNITSATAGIAFDNGTLGNLEESLKTYYPDEVNLFKSAITTKDLLNMTAGLRWDEDKESSPLFELIIQNPITNLLRRNLISIPGDAFNYNSMLPHLLADMISKESGLPYEDYVQQELFGPLGIEDFRWERDPQSAVWGGQGLQLTVRNLAKIGQLYLNGGQWEEKQILSSEWVKQSFQSQIEIPGADLGYSFQWWISESLDTKVVLGQGYGGQFLILLPEYDAMIISIQEYLISEQQGVEQPNTFLNEIFPLLYSAITN